MWQSDRAESTWATQKSGTERRILHDLEPLTDELTTLVKFLFRSRDPVKHMTPYLQTLSRNDQMT